MNKIKSLAAKSAAAADLFLERLQAAAATPSDPLPLRAATLFLRGAFVASELRRRKDALRPHLEVTFGVCLRTAVAENNPSLMHYTTALMASMIEKKVVSARDFGPLINEAVLETYHAFSARIPQGLAPKGPVLLRDVVAGAPVRKTARVSDAVHIVMPDLMPSLPVVSGREKAFSGAAYGGYMLALLQAVEANISNTPLLEAAFSAMSWELTRLNQKKTNAEGLPQLPQITQTLARITLTGLEMNNPLAVHHCLKAVTFLWQHEYIEKAQCSTLISREAIHQIGQSIHKLPEAGYQGRLGMSGQGLFLAQLRDCALLSYKEHNQFLDNAKRGSTLQGVSPSQAFATEGVLKAVAVSFEAAKRFKRTVPLCQLQTLARDVGALAIEASEKNIYSLLSSSVVAMGTLMAAHKGVRPTIFKQAVAPNFVAHAFAKVAKPVLRYPNSDEAERVMRFFAQLDSRRLLPESITPDVRAYKVTQRKVLEAQ